MSYLRFPVSHSMAPLSRLLVYYVRENGEGVTDSLQIPVQPDFENQVCMRNINRLKWRLTVRCKMVCSYPQRSIFVNPFPTLSLFRNRRKYSPTILEITVLCHILKGQKKGELSVYVSVSMQQLCTQCNVYRQTAVLACESSPVPACIRWS